ncbi:MAG: chorismate synthase [Alistipes sp.]|jgi:chorismate synthase|nr:chorismate synthase [Alistipes sp.]
MNRFGHNFRVSLFGESHGEAVGVIVDGVAPGIELSAADFEVDLARRRGGGTSSDGSDGGGLTGTTPRREADVPEMVSGVYEGHTTGAPLAIVFRNCDVRSGDYTIFADHPRPSHADLVARQKFGGHNDPRGGGHFSGRLTLCLVTAGVVAKKVLASRYSEIEIAAEIVEIGGGRDNTEFNSIIAAAMADTDSVGGVIECRAAGVPAGLGEPFFDSVESVAAHLLFSIPGVKGVEFGSGFAGAASRGSQNNDPIIDAQGTTATNNSGGVVGGITNGGEIVVRVAVKPTASIARPQRTFNLATWRVEPLSVGGRHDACIALRAAVVVEACMAIALADLV